MEVIDNTNTLVEFSAVDTGECFYYDNCLFIKSRPIVKGDVTVNCFCFADNNISYFKDDILVSPVDATITVHKKGVKE